MKPLHKSTHIMWIHGWGSNQSVWDPVIQYLPGYSHCCPSFSTAEKFTDLLSLIEAELTHENNILVGWSMGGMLALEIAEKFPDRVEKLILINSSTKFISSDPAFGWSESVLRRMIRNLNCDFKITLDQFINSCFDQDQCSNKSLSEFKKVLYQDDPVNNCDFTLNALVAGLDYLMKTDITPNAASIETPTLWLHSQNDSICPVGGFNRMKSSYKDSIIHHFEFLPDDGHISFYLNSKLTADLIYNFIT